MFDARLRPLIDPPLKRMGQALAAAGLSANFLTLLGLGIGLGGAVAIGFGAYATGLALILLNRLIDGLDGAVARANGPSDFGGYLDIVADFTFYIAVPVGFGFAAAGNLPYAMVLVATFVLTGISFLAFAVVAEKRGLETAAHGAKSFFYSTGLAEGTEVILAFVLMCLLPSYFPLLASGFAILCLLTGVQRTLLAWMTFR